MFFCRWSVTNKVIAGFRSKSAQRICCCSDNRFSCNIFRSIIQSTVNHRAPTSSADRQGWKLKIGLFFKLCVKVQRLASPLSRTDWLTDWLQSYCIPWVPVMKSKPHGDRKYFLSCASFSLERCRDSEGHANSQYPSSLQEICVIWSCSPCELAQQMRNCWCHTEHEV